MTKPFTVSSAKTGEYLCDSSYSYRLCEVFRIPAGYFDEGRERLTTQDFRRKSAWTSLRAEYKTGKAD